MKAEMFEDGVIKIIPESGVEAYALRKWSESALIQAVDLQRMEDGYWRGSSLLIDANWPRGEEQ